MWMMFLERAVRERGIELKELCVDAGFFYMLGKDVGMVEARGEEAK